MVKNGSTSSGRSRWRCKACRITVTRTRVDRTREAEFRLFQAWISGKQSLAEIASTQGVSRRTMARKLAWCWLISTPAPAVTGRVWEQIFIDGTYLDGWCLLIASSATNVVAWHWCRRESTTAYRALLEQFPAPTVITTDGHAGALAAIREACPDSAVQRCLVHIQRRVRALITSNPRTDAGKTLRALSLQLTRITTHEQAIRWLQHLNDFCVTYDTWLKHRTYRRDVTAADIPAWARRNSTWWYTHRTARQALHSMQTPIRDGHLFTYLNDFDTPIAPTTNALEGGINATLKRHVDHHRGLTGERLRRFVDWFLYTRTEAHRDPIDIAREQHFGATATATAKRLLTAEDQTHRTGVNEDGAPALYDTAIDTDYTHSIGIQHGWVGNN